MIIKWFLRINILLTFLLICLGGLVHNTGSSLACPDWPLCYGELMPEMVGGVLVEHSHRLLATLVGFITTILLIVSFVKSLPQRKLFIGALSLVIFQGVLGGITVIYRLPTFVSTAHLATSMIFLLTLVFIHQSYSPITFTFTSQDKKVPPQLPRTLFLALILIYLQMVWGAAIRHLGLGSACGMGWSNGLFCQDMIQNSTWGFPSSVEAWMHYAHRIMGIIIAAFVLYLSKIIPKSFKLFNIPVRNLLLSFVAIQVFIGMWTAASGIGVVPTTIHLGLAALILMTFFLTLLNVLDVIAFAPKMNVSRWTQVFLDYLSLTKPRLAALVLVTSYLGIIIAAVHMEPLLLVGLLVGIMSTVAGACVINCYMESELDAKMIRTANRAIPAGRVSPTSAFIFGASLVAFGLFITYFSSNLLTFLLGLTASILYVAFYTPLKTRTPLAVFVGAIPGAIPPMMGYSGATGQISFLAVLLFLVLFFWQIPHFLSISIRYAQDYQKAGIKIYPNVLGLRSTQLRMFIFCILIVALAVSPYLLGETNSLPYVQGSAIFALIFLVLNAQGFFINTGNTAKILLWSKVIFWSSLVYLPAQLVWIFVWY